MKLPKVYEPDLYEHDIYRLWEKSQAFTPRQSDKGSFAIVVPPPNANGDLHLGHGLTMAIEDILVRYHRLKGEAALLLPGADHAGFETQVVYEKELAKTGKSRFDFTREQLYDQIYDFVAQNKTNYEDQFRMLGAGVDWDRYTFTLDQKIVDRAFQTFKKMWQDGLIYRGNRLVNFCTFHGTAFADIEVLHKEESGHLWHITYPLTDGSGEVVVATTRPETMLGDTAVAVHPKDKRYSKFVGKTAKLPLTKREIPIIADEMVDQKFGTGAVKITPAHDPNDFEVGHRHDLPFVTVIDNEGRMTDVDEPYRGLTVEEGRKKVVEDLKEQGFLTKIEDISHSVGHCYKCGTVIQPLLRDQWFVDMQPLVKPTLKALKNNEITFHPANKKRQLATYLEGLRDWNISRQIAWGIPIPAFQNVDDPDDWIYDERVGEEFVRVAGKTYRRDPDVFDTWFSSSSWPYATLSYPNHDDFQQFYPINVMETGADILYPWVSRMIMMGLYVTGKVPFTNVYLHGLIQDEHGAKMSKSKGNVVDPMQKVKEFGSDAFRMGIVADESPGNNRPYDQSKIVGARNFCNKLWNVARFVEDIVGDQKQLRHAPEPKTSADHWMLTRLQQSVLKVGKDLDKYRIAEAYDTIYHLLWDDFADWYIEASKEQVNVSVLAYALEAILQIAHPFAPFVTETIWQTMAWEKDSLVVTSHWPSVPKGNATEAKTFEDVKAVVTEIRTIQATLSTKQLDLEHAKQPFYKQHGALIGRLAHVSVEEAKQPGKGSMKLLQSPHPAWLQIDPKVRQKFAAELADKAQQQKQIIKQLQGRLANKSYVSNAPATIVEQTKNQLAEAERIVTEATAQIKRYK